MTEKLTSREQKFNRKQLSLKINDMYFVKF